MLDGLSMHICVQAQLIKELQQAISSGVSVPCVYHEHTMSVPRIYRGFTMCVPLLSPYVAAWCPLGCALMAIAAWGRHCSCFTGTSPSSATKMPRAARPPPRAAFAACPACAACSAYAACGACLQHYAAHPMLHVRIICTRCTSPTHLHHDHAGTCMLQARVRSVHHLAGPPDEHDCGQPQSAAQYQGLHPQISTDASMHAARQRSQAVDGHGYKHHIAHSSSSLFLEHCQRLQAASLLDHSLVPSQTFSTLREVSDPLIAKYPKMCAPTAPSPFLWRTLHACRCLRVQLCAHVLVDTSGSRGSRWYTMYHETLQVPVEEAQGGRQLDGLSRDAHVPLRCKQIISTESTHHGIS